ncbi:Oxalate oxidase GF-2.8 [Triticum urartu]|uniref:Germin-like protein n=1 Tax=Triticum urartu TaxID=4572 RepID=M7YAW9_TRIUA|nr:Oxalate oxidase GF-2.8 [Triticum urartu]
MGCSKTLVAGLFAMLFLAPAVLATDPDPLQDFCVADLDGKAVSVNGHTCKPMSEAGDDFLFSSNSIPRRQGGLGEWAHVQAHVGGRRRLPLLVQVGQGRQHVHPERLGCDGARYVAEWPGTNTLGVSMNRVVFAPGGTNPPHIHPRATEIGIVMKGELLVGILGSLDSRNKLYSRVVRAGETFLIPRGLMHFQFNVGKTEASMVVSFNSQNPGIVFVPLTLFGSNPPIPTPVLTKALRVEAGVVELLKSKFAAGF